jgi:DNA-binding NtrC family response regulator
MIPLPKATLLLIEPEIRMQQNLAVVLRLAGYEPRFARDAQEGFAALHTYHVDLIVLAYRLPEMAGMQFYETFLMDKKFREIKDLPVIVMTGEPIPLHEKWRFFRLGAKALIIKGTEVNDMIRIIAREVDAYRSAQEAPAAVPWRASRPEYLSYLDKQAVLRTLLANVGKQPKERPA